MDQGLDVFAYAQPSLCKGNYYEPRWLYNSVDLPAGGDVLVDANTFRNGERWPVHLTHILWAIRDRDSEAFSTDEREIQNVACRLHGHDTYYQTVDYTLLPLWHTARVALPTPIGFGESSVYFLRPILLPTRAAMRCNVSLEQAELDGVTRRVGVSFHGQGNKSRQPRILGQQLLDLAAADSNTLITDIADFSNDGYEDIVLTSMSVFCSAPSNAVGAAVIGNIRRARVALSMTGGSGNDFTLTPSTSPPIRGCPASLLGVSGGRAIVHEIPQGGWILQPNRAFNMELRSLSASALQVVTAAFGYAIIP